METGCFPSGSCCREERMIKYFTNSPGVLAVKTASRWYW